MMKITLIAAGKLKETYLKAGVEDYKKRLGRYCDFEIIEVADSPDRNTPSLLERQKLQEGEAMLGVVPKGSFLWALDMRGKSFSSEEFAARIEALSIGGESHICFFIGGSRGLGENVLKKCALVSSFSSLTFPHGLFRLIFTEQLYRAFKIISSEPYHK